MKFIFSSLLLASVVYADVYLQNPRGSNNRLDESTRDRTNSDRLFDSQNNDRGGYNAGYMRYYAGSKLMVEWTNQHSCGSPNAHCEIILQYACSSGIRDGVFRGTIPTRANSCRKSDCSSDNRFGMHEDFDYYQNCKLRERNHGLFTADQNLKRDRATHTRQNAAGTRRGYECAEERDYYPYWHPTIWKDIAIFTNDLSRCAYYQAESENVKGRGYCYIPEDILANSRNIVIPNNKADCDVFTVPRRRNQAEVKGVWQAATSHNLDAPECLESRFSRDNHHGNTLGGYPLNYNWTIPDQIHDTCVMRIRYNISTAEYDGDGTSNGQNENNGLAEKYSFDLTEASQRGYVFKNDPEVNVFENAKQFKLQLAINTAQFGRTFQDRSHVFKIEERPKSYEGKEIHNVNVRGKRGNIVQVYPAVEYDFIPNTLEVSTDDYVHFQWTGSDSNPRNNAGQGKSGTDRHNVVLQRAQVYPKGNGLSSIPKYGHWGSSYPEMISNTTFLGISKPLLRDLATLQSSDFKGDDLDDAEPRYDFGLKKVTEAGVYHYMSTRNNNFSNRSQKGRIIVKNNGKKKRSIAPPAFREFIQSFESNI